MTRTDDVQKLIQSWEKESGIDLSQELRKKLHERIERLAKEEFKTGMEYQMMRMENNRTD